MSSTSAKNSNEHSSSPSTIVDVRIPLASEEPNQKQIDSFISDFLFAVGSRPVEQSEEDAIDAFLESYRRAIREHAA